MLWYENFDICTRMIYIIPVTPTTHTQYHLWTCTILWPAQCDFKWYIFVCNGVVEHHKNKPEKSVCFTLLYLADNSVRLIHRQSDHCHNLSPLLCVLTSFRTPPITCNRKRRSFEGVPMFFPKCCSLKYWKYIWNGNSVSIKSETVNMKYTNERTFTLCSTNSHFYTSSRTHQPNNRAVSAI